MIKRYRPYLSTIAIFGLLTVGSVCLPTVSAQEDIVELEEKAMQAAVRHVADSVVAIETFGGLEKVGKLLVGTGPTTGLIVSEDGYIISSAFNFVQKPSSILVTLPGGKRSPATIVARDHSRMLVLLKVETEEKLSVPTALPRQEQIVGQWAIAVGRTYNLQRVNMSVGILSATNRIWGIAIQTDAKISPNNYGGPLIDIRGRVLGVLVPLSPQSKGVEIAGAEWYDSGIGFAIPLDEIQAQLLRLKKGEDLYPGIMGVSLKGNDMYSIKVEVAACPVNSPAGKAGIKPGDIIVEVDGAIINRQVQLRHALGPRYAGDSIRVVVLRGDQRIESTVELIDKLDPYQHPFLGILPKRSSGDSKKGVEVRYVYPSSPAEKASIEIGDRLTKLNDSEIPDGAGMQELIALLEPGTKAAITLERGERSLTVEATLATLPIKIPTELPPAHDKIEPAEGDLPTTGMIEIKIPEEKNRSIAYVPPTYHGDLAHGLVVWLHAPGKFDQEQLLQQWKDLCSKNDLILLAPQSANPDKWQPTEIDFIRKVMDEVGNQYNIDPRRIVVHGHQGGGAMAFFTAFKHSEIIRAVAVTDAALPVRIRLPANDPIQRIAIYTTHAEKSKLAKQVGAGIKRLQKLKFPVTVKKRSGSDRYLNAEELLELARWIDSLDRI